MSRATLLVTAEQLERQPEDDYRYELVDGRVIRTSPVGIPHARVVPQLLFLIKRHLERTPVGVVFSELGFKLKSNPDTVRAPDVAFIRKERMPSPESRGFFHGPPDLAIEVLSPEDRAVDVRTKAAEYLSCGALCVVVVNPVRRSVTVSRRLTVPVTLRATDDVVDLGDVISGFSCSLGEIFE